MKTSYKVYPDEFFRAGEASSQCKKMLQKLGIADETVRKIAIGMYEAEINMVIHANGGTIDCEVTKDRVKITIQDDGPGIEDVDLAMEEGYSTASKEVRDLGFGAGMGLPNMKKNADVLKISSIKDVGTTVYMEILV